MQVSVEDLGGLERRVTVQVPAERIAEAVQGRIVQLSKRVKLDGFRQGKVPVKVVSRMYGPQVRQEVVGELIEQTFQDALREHQLRLAGNPSVEPIDAGDGDALQYAATFEVLPEFEVAGVEALTVERPAASVADADVDAMLENLRKQRTEWSDVARASQEGDRVTISFHGKKGGEDFPGNKGEDVPVVLGAGQMIKEFEAGLYGMTSEETKDLSVTFPEDYHAKDLAGQVVQFSVSVTAVAEPQLPQLDDQFAAGFGIEEGGLEGLRKALRENMERELAEGVRGQVKRQVMQGLFEANPIQLPQAMVSEEVERLAGQVGFRLPEGDAEAAAQAKAEAFGGEARRRVALGLIISKLVSSNGLRLDESQVRGRIEAMAASYQDPEEVVRWYYQNPKAMEGVRALALEEQVVDWVLERAQVTDKPSSFDDVMKAGKAAQEG